MKFMAGTSHLHPQISLITRNITKLKRSFITKEPRPNGSVMVEGPPIPFSPFSVADCTMLSHFSFNDFIAVAFPDLAGDLDIQI